MAIFIIWQIYNGFAGFFDYGPLGVELKRNIKDAWWRDVVQVRDDIVGLDSSIISNPKVGLFVRSFCFRRRTLNTRIMYVFHHRIYAYACIQYSWALMTKTMLPLLGRFVIFIRSDACFSTPYGSPSHGREFG